MKMEGFKIDEGAKAKLTIFDPDRSWKLNDTSNLSKSRNSPFWNSELKGEVIGTINGTNIKLK